MSDLEVVAPITVRPFVPTYELTDPAPAPAEAVAPIAGEPETGYWQDAAARLVQQYAGEGVPVQAMREQTWAERHPTAARILGRVGLATVLGVTVGLAALAPTANPNATPAHDNTGPRPVPTASGNAGNPFLTLPATPALGGETTSQPATGDGSTPPVPTKTVSPDDPKDQLPPSQYHGETFPWGNEAARVGDEQATASLQHKIDVARAHGAVVDTFCHDGVWGIASIMYVARDGRRVVLHGTEDIVDTLDVYMEMDREQPATVTAGSVC